MDNMLNSRYFTASMGNAFNWHISDKPPRQSQKFEYAVDWTTATRNNLMEYTERVLIDDLARLEEFFRSWRLKRNPKTFLF